MIRDAWYEQKVRDQELAAETAAAKARPVIRGSAKYIERFPKHKDNATFKPLSVFIPTIERDSCINGYLHAHIAGPGPVCPFWDVNVNNGDDWAIKHQCRTEAEALASLEQLISLAPIRMGEIIYLDIGYDWNC